MRIDPKPAILTFFLFSGATGLVYEVAWVRMLSLVFGVASFAVATVLAAFMGGLAIGAFLFGKIADRRRNPLAIYGLLEIAIGAYALAVPSIFSHLPALQNALYHSAFGVENPALFALARFLICGAVLIPPTLLMGGTLPLLVRWWTSDTGSDRGDSRIATLYGLNTIGAVAGTVAAGFILLPSLGLQATIQLTAGVNFLIGFGILIVSPYAPLPPIISSGTGGDHPVTLPPVAPGVRRLVLIVSALSGLIALGSEIYWTRILVLIIGPSAYAFTTMLATFLAGIALGSLAVKPLLKRAGDKLLLLGSLQLAVSLFTLSAMLLFTRFPGWFVRLSAWADYGESSFFLVPIPLIFLTILPPTLAMGAAFPVAAHLVKRPGESRARSVGILYTVNTLGGIAGSYLTGFFLLPALGTRSGMTLLVASSALLGIGLLVAARPGRARLRTWVTAAALFFLLGGAKVVTGTTIWDENLMTMGPFQRSIRDRGQKGERLEDFFQPQNIVYYAEGLNATITVRETNGTFTVQTNGKTDASSGGDMRTQVLLGQLPALFHPAPEKGLVIGLASGISAAHVIWQGAESLVAVELEPAMLEACRFFSPWNGNLLDRSTVDIRIEDGRNYLLATDDHFDVIVSEPSNPWISGVNNLFTREAFLLIRKSLRPGGIVAQWFHYYSMGEEDLLSLLRTFSDVFPYVDVFLSSPGDLVLLGSESPILFDITRLAIRMEEKNSAAAFRTVGIQSPLDLLSLYLFSINDETRTGVREKLASYPMNTDDNMLLEFSAPRHLYDRESEKNRDVLARFQERSKVHIATSGNYLGLAEGSVRAWDLPGALEELRLESESAEPDWAGIHNLRARILLLRAGREQKAEFVSLAIEEVESALAVDSLSSTAHLLLGSAWLQKREPARAADRFSRALELGEDPALVLSFLGTAREMEGRAGDAIEAYRRALELDPANPVARQGLARLVQAER